VKEPYTVVLSAPARRSLGEKLALDAVIGVADFLEHALAANPHRVGKQLDPPLDDVYSARVMREWRVLYVIDDSARRVLVTAIGHRRDVYRT
jgi:mRNA interferase RelE/StbE